MAESGMVAVRSWYPVYCKPQQDERAQNNLENQGFEVFRPLACVHRRSAGKRIDRVESMFPRYLFVHLAANVDDWGPIRSTRGVVGLVRFGNQPVPAPDAVVEALRERGRDVDGVIDLRPNAGRARNTRVRIESGPFAGFEGLFQQSKGEDRVLILLDIMNRSQPTTLPADTITNAT